MRIAVLYGGTSSERPVSIKTGESIIKHIDSKKYDIFPMDFDGDFKNLIYQIRENDINLVFNALHGGDGENGILQSKFEKNLIDVWRIAMVAGMQLLSAVIGGGNFIALSQQFGSKKKMLVNRIAARALELILCRLRAMLQGYLFLCPARLHEPSKTPSKTIL